MARQHDPCTCGHKATNFPKDLRNLWADFCVWYAGSACCFRGGEPRPRSVARPPPRWHPNPPPFIHGGALLASRIPRTCGNAGSARCRGGQRRPHSDASCGQGEHMTIYERGKGRVVAGEDQDVPVCDNVVCHVAISMGAAYRSSKATCTFLESQFWISAHGASHEQRSKRPEAWSQATAPTRSSRACPSVTAAGVSHSSPIHDGRSIVSVDIQYPRRAIA